MESNIKSIHLRVALKDFELLSLAKGSKTWENWAIDLARQQVLEEEKRKLE